MEIPSHNAFKVIFPRYTELLSTGSLHTSADIENFVRNELPQKIEMVRKMQLNFTAFLTQYTNLILKRPQQNNLIHSLLLKATERTDKYFQSLELKINKLDKNSLEQDFEKMNFPQVRTTFRSKLKSMEQLLQQKYFGNHSMDKKCEEEATIRLYNLFEIYHFTKADLVTAASKYRLSQNSFLQTINSKKQILDISQLMNLDSSFINTIRDTVNKRCRPFINKRDFLQTKTKQILRQTQSKVGQNFNIFLDAFATKERYRINKQITSMLQKQLRSMSQKTEEELECKEIMSEVDLIKKQFHKVKNNAYFIDIMRGNFSDRYKMELNKLDNLYYLSNLEKYLQDVAQFLQKLLRLEQKIIKNRKNFMKNFGSLVQEKISSLITYYTEKSYERRDILEIIQTQFEGLQNSLYGIVKQQKAYTTGVSANEEKRRRKMEEAEERKQKYELQRKQREMKKQEEMEKKKEEEKRRREEERVKMQQKRKIEEERIQKLKRQKQEKERQKREEQERVKEIKKQEMAKKQQERKKKEIQEKQKRESETRRKQQEKKQQQEVQRQRREKLKRERQDKERLIKEQAERKKGQEEQKRRKQRQALQKKKEEEKRRVEEEKRQKEELENEKRKKEQVERKKKQEQKMRLLEEEKQRKRKLEEEKQQKEQKQKQQKERRQNEERKKRQQKSREEERIRKEEQNRKMEEVERKKQEEEEKKKQLQLKKKKEEQERIRKQEEIKRQQEEERRRKDEEERKKKQAEEQKKRKELQEKKKRQLEEKKKRDEEERQRERQKQRKQKQQKDKKQKLLQQQRKKEEERKQKQLIQLKKKEEEKKITKKEPKKSAMNYGGLEDQLLSDQEPQQPTKPLNNKSGVDEQYNINLDDEEYGDDFDEESPEKEGQHPIQTKQLIAYENVKCLNDYLKSTQYARKNKPNLEPFNNTNHYIYIFEELIQNKKLFIFQSSISKGIYDFSKELLDDNNTEEDLKITLETVREAIYEAYEKQLQEKNFDPRTQLVFPFSFPNDLSVQIIEVLPAYQNFQVILSSQLSEDEQIRERYSSLVQAFLHIFQIQGQPRILDYVIPEDSKMVLQTFDKQTPNLLTLFAMHYEHAFQNKIQINQYTIERFFYTSQILQPFYELIEQENEAITAFYDELAQKYSHNDKVSINIVQIQTTEENYEEVIGEQSHHLKQAFLQGKSNTLLVLFQVLIVQDEESFEKVVVYLEMTKGKEKPTMNYYIISKDDAGQENASQVFEMIASEADDKFETSVYIDYTRHNGPYQYSDWTLPLWAHMIVKRKMNPINAMRGIVMSMAPYYVAFKQMD